MRLPAARLQHLWVDPQGGTDSNSGTSQADALHTFNAAWDLVGGPRRAELRLLHSWLMGLWVQPFAVGLDAHAAKTGSTGSQRANCLLDCDCRSPASSA